MTRRSRFFLLPLLAIFLLALTGIARAQETIPPKPERYFNDYTGKIDPVVANDLNHQLEQLERDTSNQIVVAIYPKLQTNSDIADYTFRIKEQWKVGQNVKNNGAVLFVFLEDQKAYIQVNYGLEGVLPDATCKHIIDQAIVPAFKVGQYDDGLRAAVAGLIAATKGEFTGTGKTQREKQRETIGSYIPCIFSILIVFVLFGILLFVVHNFGGSFYQSHVRSLTFAENFYLFILQMGLSLIFSGGSSRSGGGSSGGGGGGGFSGGGGTGGGGGAGGSW